MSHGLWRTNQVSPGFPWALLASLWLVVTGYRLIVGDLDDRLWLWSSVLAYVVLPINAGGLIAWLILSRSVNGRLLSLIGSACLGLLITLANLITEAVWQRLSRPWPEAPGSPDVAQSLLSSLGYHPDVLRVVTMIGLLLGLVGGLGALTLFAVVVRWRPPSGRRQTADGSRLAIVGQPIGPAAPARPTIPKTAIAGTEHAPTHGQSADRGS